MQILVRVQVKKGHGQGERLTQLRGVCKPYHPVYTIVRRCISGDVEYRVALNTDFPEEAMEALSYIGDKVSLLRMGEA